MRRRQTGNDRAIEASQDRSPSADRDSIRLGLVVILMALSAVVVIAGWQAAQLHAAAELQQQRAQLLAAGRDRAVLLTTISYTDAEAKGAEILASASGLFLEDFQNRSQSFLDTVQRARSDTAGTVVEAGLESVHGDQADVLVVMSVATSLAGKKAPPRLWRMRIGLEQLGAETKVSDVEFLP